MHGLPAQERREAKRQQAQANEQIALLERGTATSGSDFSTYRYLATEGFLPGYNFPRLPLYAYVPAVAGGGANAAYLQRARFVAIAEFGPRSLIYHEGRAYRVYKAKLPPGIRAEEGDRLATEVFYICDECGAAHREEPERCHVCGASMGGIHPVRNVLRIDNVETLPAERITANDEDRADVKGPDYPSKTFRVLKKNEIARFGEYRTARLVLAAYDQLMSQPLAAE
jgi:hypothetical protein